MSDTTMKAQTYTAKQVKVMLNISLNYETMAQNLSDNCTPVDARDVAKILHCSKEVANGVLVSLFEKDIVMNDEVNGKPIYMVTEFGIEEIFRLMEDGDEEAGSFEAGLVEGIAEAERVNKEKVEPKKTKTTCATVNSLFKQSKFPNVRIQYDYKKDYYYFTGAPCQVDSIVKYTISDDDPHEIVKNVIDQILDRTTIEMMEEYNNVIEAM